MTTNPVLETIFKRRSIRRYKPEPVVRETLELLIRAGMYAPSAHDRRSWHFIVCDEREVIDRLRDTHPYAKMLDLCPVCILVCGDRELESQKNYYIEDCSAATQNILLAATSLGLGTCWMGIRPSDPEMQRGFHDLFLLPENIVPFGLIAVGPPAVEKEAPERFEPDKLHWNKW